MHNTAARLSPFRPPVDLSDLPNYAHAPGRPRCSVFIGRVSTKDNQNPATSIPRQVLCASACLEEGEEFAAYFWDVESGMLPPELRGLGPQKMYDSLDVPTPRTGGLQDLVERCEELGVTHALSESSDRLARAMLTSLTVEHELERLGVDVVYANEPTGGTESGRLRTRRYGQVEAEIYRTALMERSTDGQVQHAINGWNHGYPPYPYIAVLDESAPRHEGGRFGPARPKKKLAPHPDPRRFDAAREMHRLRREEHLSTPDIMAALAQAPDQYPIKTQWTHNLVNGLLANPKLTGYQVFNRKASRTGRPGQSVLNPLSEWIWSPRETHEPVITVEQWKAAQQATAELKAGGRSHVTVQRLQAAAARRGLTVTPLRECGTHTVCLIGEQQVVVPHPVPDALIRQIINHARRAS
ncbi:recombinase family protein [Streptomyces sp. NPDC048442]|uniref:recombinase family protein n=1 Tax=Streptomyces sp. NPDC048442 TaxID=3154823 RepID=UPI00341C8ACA